MRWLLFVLTLCAVSARAPEALAQSSGPLTLDEVLRGLDARHPLLDAALVEQDIAEGDRQAAEGAFDVAWKIRGTVVPLGGYPSGRIDTVIEVPTPFWGTTFFSGYRWGSDTFAPYDGKLETNELGEVRVGAAVPFWRDGPIDRRRANIRRAEIGKQLAALSVEERRIELTRQASLRYWDWVGAGQKLRITKRVLQAALDRDEDVGSRVSAGDIPAIERTENARAILQRRQQVNAAERGLTQAAFELSLFYRDARGEPLAPSPDQLPTTTPFPVPVARITRRTIVEAMGRRPEIARLGHLRAQGAVEREWAGNQRAPAIDFTVLASQDLGEGSEKRRPFELELSLLIDIPIERNVAEGRVKAADAQVARVEAQSRFAADQIAAQVSDADNALEMAYQRYTLARGEVTVARELEQAEREKFALGDSTLLFVNLREQASLDAAVREVDAIVDYHRARAVLDAATATGPGPRRR